MTALERARVSLWRAAECNTSMQRSAHLYQAKDALAAAGYRCWAQIIESEAARIAGNDDTETMRRLKLDIDQEINRRRGNK